MERSSGKYQFRLIATAALLLGAGCSAGCMHFCRNLSYVGRRHECPEDCTPVVAAYADAAGMRLSVKYRAIAVGASRLKPEDRWLNVSPEMMADALRAPAKANVGFWQVVLPIDPRPVYFVAPSQLPAKRPQWNLKEMTELKVFMLSPGDGSTPGPSNVPQDASGLCVRRGGGAMAPTRCISQ